MASAWELNPLFSKFWDTSAARIKSLGKKAAALAYFTGSPDSIADLYFAEASNGGSPTANPVIHPINKPRVVMGETFCAIMAAGDFSVFFAFCVTFKFSFFLVFIS